MAEIEVRHLSKVFAQKGGRTQALKDIKANDGGAKVITPMRARACQRVRIPL